MYYIDTGNCIDLLNKKPTHINDPGLYNLIFADPPFNIKENYDQYKDQLNEAEYRDFTMEWMCAAWNCTSGVMVVHGPLKLLYLYLIFADSFNVKILNSGIWYYRFGQYQRNNFIHDHEHWIAFGKEGAQWFPEAIEIDSVRLKIGDKRIENSEYNGKRPPGCCFGIDDGKFCGRVQGNNKERWKDHPNQLPQKYLQRFVRAYTKIGDWILDPFCGSGTTGIVAVREHRNFRGIDISSKYVESAKERIDYGFYRK